MASSQFVQERSREPESMEALQVGKLTLEDFRWEEDEGPKLSFNDYSNNHTIPEIDMKALLEASRDVDLESMEALQVGKLTLEDFQWEEDERPKLPFNDYTNNYTIPEIDMKALLEASRGEDLNLQSQTIKDLISAATEWGFFQVYNHGIPHEILEQMHAFAREFFAMPFDEKRDEMGTFYVGYHGGYSAGNPMHATNKWWMEFLRFTNEILDSIPDLKCFKHHPTLSDDVKQCNKMFLELSKKITKVILRVLQVSQDDVNEFINKYISDDYMGVKVTHYPKCPQPSLTGGLPSHTDLSIITLIHQDEVGGLQVLNDGVWTNVKPRRDALVVNLGDILQVWSNDKLKSASHRVVVNPNTSRYSTTFFFNPALETIMAPLKSIVEVESPKFKSISLLDYRKFVFDSFVEKRIQGPNHLRILKEE